MMLEMCNDLGPASEAHAAQHLVQFVFVGGAAEGTASSVLRSWGPSAHERSARYSCRGDLMFSEAVFASSLMGLLGPKPDTKVEDDDNDNDDLISGG